VLEVRINSVLLEPLNIDLQTDIIFPPRAIECLKAEVGVSPIFFGRIARVTYGATAHVGTPCFTRRDVNGKVTRFGALLFLGQNFSR